MIIGRPQAIQLPQIAVGAITLEAIKRGLKKRGGVALDITR
jgi:hypothetical protein